MKKVQQSKLTLSKQTVATLEANPLPLVRAGYVQKPEPATGLLCTSFIVSLPFTNC
jgi:hypothetical protein